MNYLYTLALNNIYLDTPLSSISLEENIHCVNYPHFKLQFIGYNEQIFNQFAPVKSQVKYSTSQERDPR